MPNMPMANSSEQGLNFIENHFNHIYIWNNGR
jgi:hypothetical protein